MEDRFHPEKVISLGTLCHTAKYLKTKNLKSESYPFDWVFASVDTVLHCLKDDFLTYLDKSFYIDATYPGPNKCGHRLFAGSFFNHRDARTEDNYAYYQRCVERFRSLLKSEEPKLFMIGFYDNWNEQQCLSKVFRLQTLLAGLTANFRLAVVIQKIGSTQSAVWETDRDIDFLRLTTLSKTSGVAFSHPEDAEFFNSNLDAKYKLE